jgi:hypothetical protein
VIVLPFAVADFRAGSVADRPGDWGARFDAQVAAVGAAGDLVLLGAAPDGGTSAAYARTNEAIVARAIALAADAGDEAVAVAVWEGAERPGHDMTAHFVRTARARGLPVDEVSTR